MDVRTTFSTSSPARHTLRVGAPEVSDGGELRLQLAGVLDGLNADTLVESFTDSLGTSDGAAGPVVLETSGLTFLDSGGIRALLRCRRAAQAHHRQLRLAGPPPAARQVLTITGLLATFGLE